MADPYYRADLALVHDRGFGFHADLCAPGILRLLEPVRERRGLVLELGCGSGLLTRHLVDAGLRVVATDASPAMLDLAGRRVPDAEAIHQLTLPDDPIPAADAIVSIGHAFNYLATVDEIERGLLAMGSAVAPGGVLAIDVCDLEWGTARADLTDQARVGDDWAIITRFSRPSPDRFVRDLTTFVRDDAGRWRRDDEHHENVLIATASIPELLLTVGIEADVRPSFGEEDLPAGLHAVVGHRAPAT